jgi:hypothetical protein
MHILLADDSPDIRTIFQFAFGYKAMKHVWRATGRKLSGFSRSSCIVST